MVPTLCSPKDLGDLCLACGIRGLGTTVTDHVTSDPHNHRGVHVVVSELSPISSWEVLLQVFPTAHGPCSSIYGGGCAVSGPFS